ncbi:hypothetical protein ACFQMH_24935 [Streptomyces viridiviolaceus]|uniref:Uncharacterized protein n=1 Tax=Streptomyces viridiviolaceus TaxID=68282 RepID=A0ABW2E7V9_9ACTN
MRTSSAGGLALNWQESALSFAPACPAADVEPRRGAVLVRALERRSDGAAASPTATMRSSWTLVSVSSVSRRPTASVFSPLGAARIAVRPPT